MPIDQQTLKTVIQNPAAHYDLPEQVLNAKDLSAEQKKAVLESWLVDEQELATATDENMGESDDNKLTLVAAALSELDKL